MKPKALVILFIWVLVYNLGLALIGFFWGIGWMIMVICARHVLLGTPLFALISKKILIDVGRLKITPVDRLWPTKRWIWETIFCGLVSLIAIIWFNIPLKELLLNR